MNRVFKTDEGKVKKKNVEIKLISGSKLGGLGETVKSQMCVKETNLHNTQKTEQSQAG